MTCIQFFIIAIMRKADILLHYIYACSRSSACQLFSLLEPRFANCFRGQHTRSIKKRASSWRYNFISIRCIQSQMCVGRLRLRQEQFREIIISVVEDKKAKHWMHRVLASRIYPPYKYSRLYEELKHFPTFGGEKSYVLFVCNKIVKWHVHLKLLNMFNIFSVFLCYFLLVEGELSFTRFCINKHIISVVGNIEI